MIETHWFMASHPHPPIFRELLTHYGAWSGPGILGLNLLWEDTDTTTRQDNK